MYMYAKLSLCPDSTAAASPRNVYLYEIARVVPFGEVCETVEKSAPSGRT